VKSPTQQVVVALPDNDPPAPISGKRYQLSTFCANLARVPRMPAPQGDKTGVESEGETAGFASQKNFADGASFLI
jgi:hypothetical protein